jgi:hypothetical protein
LRGAAIAQIVQRRGVLGFEVGIVSLDFAAQLKAYTLAAAEAVIWLGIWQSTLSYDWNITL